MMHVPEGWTYTTIEEHIDLLSGFPFKSENYSTDSEDILLLRGDNIEPGSLRWRDAKRWSRHEISHLKKYELEIGDFVIAMDRTWISSGLKVAEVKASDIPCLLVQRISRIRAKKDFSQSLLKQIFSTHRFEQYVKGVQTETAVPHISAAQIREFPVLVPPLAEQQKIAQIFSTWDKAIEKLEALIAAKKKRKKALMQQLLTGKKRFVGFEEEWKEIAIRQMGKIVSGGTPDTNIKEYWDGDILWMTPTDVTALKNRFISETARKITNKGQKNSSATIIPAGSLLVCTRATIGIMSISTTDITTNQGFKNLVPNKNFDVEFLYYLFSHSKDKFIRYACGSTFFELSKKDFEKLTFKCPGLQEQQKIASILSAADNEIETRQKHLSALKEQKKALMQQLLTGKKRVKVDNHV